MHPEEEEIILGFFFFFSRKRRDFHASFLSDRARISVRRLYGKIMDGCGQSLLQVWRRSEKASGFSKSRKIDIY